MSWKDSVTAEWQQEPSSQGSLGASVRRLKAGNTNDALWICAGSNKHSASYYYLLASPVPVDSKLSEQKNLLSGVFQWLAKQFFTSANIQELLWPQSSLLTAPSLQQQPHSVHTSNTGFLQGDKGRRKGNKTKSWPKGYTGVTVSKL